MHTEFLPLLRDLRARYGDEAILDQGRLAGMLADVLSGGKEGERRLPAGAGRGAATADARRGDGEAHPA